MGVISNLVQQLRVIDSKSPDERQDAYEDFTNNCRDFALTRASKGKFEEALHIIHWLGCEGLEPEDDNFRSDFYVSIAKIILTGKNLLEASLAFQNQEFHVKALKDVIHVFKEPDVSKLREFVTVYWFKDKII
jgi:hypothetical protein